MIELKHKQGRDFLAIYYGGWSVWEKLRVRIEYGMKRTKKSRMVGMLWRLELDISDHFGSSLRVRLRKKGTVGKGKAQVRVKRVGIEEDVMKSRLSFITYHTSCNFCLGASSRTQSQPS